MEKILIGTSGYSYDDWVGPFYPSGTKQADFLEYYSREFPVAELNFTYYRMPDAYLTKRMALLTPGNFLFSIKAHKTLTHEIRPEAFRAEAAAFLSGIEPIIDVGKLGAVLLQFPFGFHYTKENRKYLDSLCSTLHDLPLAVEFRNNQWQKESVSWGLRERGIALVNVDEPDLAGLLSAQDLVTSQIGYVRFHGRNCGNWWKGDNVTRYDYLYNDEELQQWAPRIMKMAESAQVILIVFNNHSKGQAIQNARRLKEMLGK
jgi:uncharacterized protein YecE (DUF72 family)